MGPIIGTHFPSEGNRNIKALVGRSVCNINLNVPGSTAKTEIHDDVHVNEFDREMIDTNPGLAHGIMAKRLIKNGNVQINSKKMASTMTNKCHHGKNPELLAQK